MQIDEAREIVRRFGEKHAALLLVEQRIKDLTAKKATLEGEIGTMRSHVATAAEQIERWNAEPREQDAHR